MTVGDTDTDAVIDTPKYRVEFQSLPNRIFQLNLRQLKDRECL